MKKIAAVLLVILGIYMIYLGGVKAPKLMLPPVISGIGFIIIALVFFADKKSQRLSSCQINSYFRILI